MKVAIIFFKPDREMGRIRQLGIMAILSVAIFRKNPKGSGQVKFLNKNRVTGVESHFGDEIKDSGQTSGKL
jgi:hypothetical protein